MPWQRVIVEPGDPTSDRKSIVHWPVDFRLEKEAKYTGWIVQEIRVDEYYKDNEDDEWTQELFPDMGYLPGTHFWEAWRVWAGDTESRVKPWGAFTTNDVYAFFWDNYEHRYGKIIASGLLRFYEPSPPMPEGTWLQPYFDEEGFKWTDSDVTSVPFWENNKEGSKHRLRVEFDVEAKTSTAWVTYEGEAEEVGPIEYPLP